LKTEELPGLMREAIRQGYKQAPQDLDKKENTPRKKTKGLKWVLGAAIGTAIAVTISAQESS
jgi:hypothetical protein